MPVHLVAVGAVNTRDLAAIMVNGPVLEVYIWHMNRQCDTTRNVNSNVTCEISLHSKNALASFAESLQWTVVLFAFRVC